MKKCNNCGKELPKDSEFCQYCGSKDVSEYIKTKHSTEKQHKVCGSCGKELPEDSEFCQYCGSKNIIKKKLDLNIYEIQEHTSKNKSIKENILLIPLILALLAAAFLGYGMYHNYREYNSLYKETEKIIAEKESLQSKLSTSNRNVESYKTKSYKYNSVEGIANQVVYSDFRTDTYFVKGTSKTVNVYCNFPGSYTIYPTVSGSGINLTWGEWTGSGYNCHCPMYVKCSSGGYGTITLTNSYNSHRVIIYVSGS